MSDLSIVTWASAAEVALGAPVEYLTVSFTTPSAQSAALATPDPQGNKRTLRVRLFSNADCFVLWGDDPTANNFSDSIPLGANNPEYFDIESGQKIAVIERA